MQKQSVFDPKKIENLKSNTILIKYGGNAMTDNESKRNFIMDVCRLYELGVIPVIVHGGGPYIAKLLEEAGVEAEFVGGHRKTDERAVEYVEMALSSKVNKEIVKLINFHGGKAVGVSGKDGKLAVAQKRTHIEAIDGIIKRYDLGQVGDVQVVDPRIVDVLKNNGYIPVIAPVCSGEDLKDYNVNADMFAGHLAGALKAGYYVVLTDVDGLRRDKDDPETLIEKMDAEQAKNEIGGIIQGGMIPKIESILIALSKGAGSAHIINGMAEHEILRLLLTGDNAGTEIFKGKDFVGIMDNAQKLEKENHFQFYKRYPITLVEGGGTRVKDSAGKEYIDALAGIAVNSAGHCHPKVVQAIQEQAAKLIHITNLYYNEPQSNLALLLTQISGMDRVFFTNSGGEAVEGALKLARRYAFKKGREGSVVSLEGCFHGRTLATTAMGKEKYKEGFKPMPGGMITIPFNDIDAFRSVVETDVIAMIIEPVQGEGGIRPVDADFLNEVAQTCKEKDILLIFDEIQCGMGRTGKMFAFEYYDVKPDILTLAKALGGGFPIGAVLAGEEVSKAFDYGIHGTTFGGNPLACAAAYAAVNAIIAENMPEQAREKGVYLFKKLNEAARKMDAIKEVRGFGLMVGVDLKFKGADVVNKMMDKGVLANCTEETVIRLVPPLIISKEELDRVFDVLIESIKEVEANG